jgi:hypothetical protein
MEFLLKKGISPQVKEDLSGWNIFHVLVSVNNCKGMKYLMDKLPRESVLTLLSQGSKSNFNTVRCLAFTLLAPKLRDFPQPLHLAVKRSFLTAARLICDFTSSGLDRRDAHGSTPLHCAVSNACPEITQLIIERAPHTLYMENGVGETAEEIISFSELSSRAKSDNSGHSRSNQMALNQQNISADPIVPDIKHLEIEIPKLRLTLEDLVRDGKATKESKVYREFSAFASLMEKLKVSKTAANTQVEGVEEERILVDHAATLKVIQDAIAKSPKGKRELVHLLDVQNSVASDLPKHVPVEVTRDADAETHKTAEIFFIQWSKNYQWGRYKRDP